MSIQLLETTNLPPLFHYDKSELSNKRLQKVPLFNIPMLQTDTENVCYFIQPNATVSQKSTWIFTPVQIMQRNAAHAPESNSCN